MARNGFRSYNFDVIDGVNYQIDITQPARYDKECKLVNPNAQRISSLTFNGKQIDPSQQFIIATNNYRAFGGKFAGTGEKYVAFSAPDENRTILADYIRRVSKEKGEVKPSADNNWSFKPINNPNLKVVFETSPSADASKFIKEYSRYPVTADGTNEDGFAKYLIDLSKTK